VDDGNQPLIERGQDALHDLQHRAEERLEDARHRVAKAGDELATRVRARPYLAVAIAAGIGFVGARLFVPHRRH
jgi:ElaB/YqjD/DUF883 family membrane-anchored ribosome-binding protein